MDGRACRAIAFINIWLLFFRSAFVSVTDFCLRKIILSTPHSAKYSSWTQHNGESYEKFNFTRLMGSYNKHFYIYNMLIGTFPLRFYLQSMRRGLRGKAKPLRWYQLLFLLLLYFSRNSINFWGNTCSWRLYEKNTFPNALRSHVSRWSLAGVLSPFCLLVNTRNWDIFYFNTIEVFINKRLMYRVF